ncbi:ribose-phosphate diphosphokinase [Propioniciclava tarda]|uniref:Ribose-phosphate pyrophosphokinase n=1 Tax=Propioniciclava tarda TaxID=433330 RepID=A0A4Q9KMS2_PROTD|nr:ribose-phosphate diphosphokinase [Propioniciclava tarda]
MARSLPTRHARGYRVSGITRPNDKHLMLCSGRAFPELAEEIADLLNVDLVPTRQVTYANSEIYVRFEESVRGADAFVIQSHPAPVNEWLMEQLIMIDALKRASAKRITVVSPFYPYGRQDKKHAGREPISARLIADLYKTAGAHRLMSVDLHAAQIQGFFDGPVDHLMALPVLADYIKSKYPVDNMTIVSPDAGRVRLADMYTDRLGAPLAIIHKRRDPNKANEVAVGEVVGDVEGRCCLLVDDMIDTAGTIVGAAKVLREHGAAQVICAATHPILSGPAIERLNASEFEEVIVTNTLPVADTDAIPKMTVLSIAPMIAKAIQEVFTDGSVTSLMSD